MQKKGKFIVFEGIDGSGKSTQIKMLAKAFEKREMAFCETLEPTYGIAGEVLHEILSGKKKADPKVTAALFVADRLDHLTNPENGVCKTLDEGKHVLCDRYYFSSYAYQSVEVPKEWVISANRLAAETLRPDCTIFIDVAPEVAMERISRNRENIELYESLERLTAVRCAYMDAFSLMKDVEKVKIFDGNKLPEEIAREIEEFVFGELL